MKATTVKLEGQLLQEIEHVKPSSQSVSAYVRELLRSSLRRIKLRSAAIEYQEFLQANPDEAEWMAQWDQSDLAAPPTPGPNT